MKLFVFVVVAIFVLHDVRTEEKKGGGWKDKFKQLLEKRQFDAKKLLNELKKASQVDKPIGKNTMRIDKSGGKLIVQRKGQYLEMKVKEFVERDENGTVVDTVSVKRTNFEIKKEMNDTTYGVESVLVEIVGTLENNANVSLKLYMFREAANITGEDGVDYELLEGSTKTNMEVDWPTDAKHIDVVFAVKCGFKGKLARKAKKLLKARAKKGKSLPSNSRSPSTMSVCTNARMTFSPRFKLNDQTWEEMPDEFPRSEEVSADGESLITLRWKGRKIFYDPISETGDDIGDVITDEKNAGLSKIPNSFLTLSMSLVLFITKLIL